MLTQVKFNVDRVLAEEFKQAVLRRRGKLDLSREGAEALRLYLREARQSREIAPENDPILKIIGIATSRGRARPNSLRDKKALYEE